MSQTLDRPTVRRTSSPTLPAAGPAWFGAVMGTGLLSTLLQLHTGQLPLAHTVATGLLGAGWLLLVALVAGFARRVAADRTVFVTSITETVSRTQWGMVAMGILSVGSATLTVLPAVDSAALRAAVVLDAALWAVGTLLGLATTVGFTALLLRRGGGAPSFTWGLPVVPPMVSATTGAALVPHLTTGLGRSSLVVACGACFVLSLVVAPVVFTVVYRHHGSVAAVAVGASATAWIPLGVVGQSTAAAQAIANQAAPLLAPSMRHDLHAMANLYGVLLLTVGVPLVAYAVAVTVRGFAARMPFTPGWWALTFPIGTLALGAHLLGGQPGLAAYEIVGLALVLVLCGTWSLCAAASVRAVVAAGNPVVPEPVAS